MPQSDPKNFDALSNFGYGVLGMVVVIGFLFLWLLT